MRAAEVRRWDALARASFTYTPDPAGTDTWRSYAAEALAGHTWSGDCDDLASTVLDLLGRAGLPLDRRWRIVANAAGNPAGDHMAGMALPDDGPPLIVGDTFGACYPAGVQAWVPLRYQRLDEAARGVWRDGAPWTGGEGG